MLRHHNGSEQVCVMELIILVVIHTYITYIHDYCLAKISANWKTTSYYQHYHYHYHHHYYYH